MSPKSSPWETLRHTILPVWLVVGVLLAGALAVHHEVFLPSGDPEHDRSVEPRADFMLFYAAGKLVRDSPGHLYDPGRQASAQAQATGLEIHPDDPGFDAFGYPPVVALLFAPLTLLPYATAYFTMIALNLLLMGIALWLLSSRLGLGPPRSQILVLCTASFFPVYATLLQGQLSFLILLLFVLVVTNLRNGHASRAGVWTGCLALKPTLFPILVCWLALQRQWKALACALGVSLFLAVGSIALVGPMGVEQYLAMGNELFSGTALVNAPWNDLNLRAVGWFFGWGEEFWLLGGLGVLGALGLTARKTLRSDWGYCAVILGTILAARHVLVHSLVITLIVVGLVLAHCEADVSAHLRWFLFSLMLLPGAYILALGGPTGLHWPVIPLVLLALFLWFLTRPPVGQPAES